MPVADSLLFSRQNVDDVLFVDNRQATQRYPRRCVFFCQVFSSGLASVIGFVAAYHSEGWQESVAVVAGTIFGLSCFLLAGCALTEQCFDRCEKEDERTLFHEPSSFIA